MKSTIKLVSVGRQILNRELFEIPTDHDYRHLYSSIKKFLN